MQTYYLVRKSKEDSNIMTRENQSFKVKPKDDLTKLYPQGKQIHYDRMKDYNRFKP